MKVPFSWLKQYVDIDVTAQELEDKLFGCGFEVEELIDLGGEISKVVVGVVTECVPQEGTHLHICKVDCGDYGRDIQISTGAANVYAGMHTAAALDGSTLPGGITIKAKPLMGIESNGMLCSGEELGLNDDLYPGSEVYGLLDLPKDTVPGTPIQEVVGLNDYIFDISITANRADCQSVLGIAREVAAVLKKPLKMPATDYTVSDTTDDRLYTIPGSPPNLLHEKPGDAFAPRNRFALNIDDEIDPPMFKISDTHYAATWLLDPRAPKVEMPPELKERIARMKAEAKKIEEAE